MDFYVFSMEDTFREKVMDPFVSVYESGLTPNPCVQCNRHLKFTYFLDRALELGYDAIATGHYAQIRQDENTGRYLLYRAVDLSKDQSYVLYCLNQEQLAHTAFPLGEMAKEQVRAIAARLVACKVKGLWNYMGVELGYTPQEIVVENVHLGDSLMILNYKMLSRYGNGDDELNTSEDAISDFEGQTEN